MCFSKKCNWIIWLVQQSQWSPETDNGWSSLHQRFNSSFLCVNNLADLENHHFQAKKKRMVTNYLQQFCSSTWPWKSSWHAQVCEQFTIVIITIIFIMINVWKLNDPHGWKHCLGSNRKGLKNAFFRPFSLLLQWHSYLQGSFPDNSFQSHSNTWISCIDIIHKWI